MLLLYSFNCLVCVVTGFQSYILLPIGAVSKWSSLVQSELGTILEPSKGDAIALGSTFIIWTCLFGVIFLKEKLHWVDMLMIPVTIGGVVLIARPPFIFGGHEYDENTLSGIFYSLISAVSIAGLYICLRKISNDVHYTIASFYYSIIGFFLISLIIWTTTGFHLICQVN